MQKCEKKSRKVSLLGTLWYWLTSPSILTRISPFSPSKPRAEKEKALMDANESDIQLSALRFDALQIPFSRENAEILAAKRASVSPF